MTRENCMNNQDVFQDVLLEPSDDDYNTEKDNLPDSARCRPYVVMTPQYIPRRGFGKYSVALRQLLPFRQNKKNVIEVDSAGFFSFITFSWLSKLIYKAYKKGLNLEDVPISSPYDSGDINAQRLAFLWQREVDKNGLKKASFRKVVWQFLQTRVLIALFIYVASVISGFVCTAIFMRKLIEFAEDPDAGVYEGLKWALIFTFSEFIKTVTMASYYALSYRTAIRLRAACLVLTYKKLICLHSLGSMSVGGIINIYGGDGGRLYYLVVFGPMIIGGPIIVTCCAFYIYYVLGPWALLGLSAFALFFPLQYFLSRLTALFRERTITKTDERIRLITEILNTIKLIKIYAWENCFLQRIQGIRNKELSLLQKAAYCQSIGTSLAPMFPVICGILMFLIHVLSGSNLTAAQAYPLVSLLHSQLRRNLLNFRYGCENIVDGLITFRRIQDVLEMEENEQYITESTDKTLAFYMNDGCFKWCDHPYGDESEEKKNGGPIIEPEEVKLTEKDVAQPGAFRLESINLYVTKGSLIGICGPIGSGKSALLKACLGQMKRISGQISKSGRSAFVSQEAWIENASLKENILFGEPFDPKRYINTLYCCALNEDVNYLPAGDETEIGERGVNLSGGQKQRVSLARAIYSNRDIYFLDDPLSAVDIQVAGHIFENCITNALSKKTVFLVTHHARFLQNCDEILVMRDGKIIERGTHHELLAKGREYSSMVRSSALTSAKKSEELIKDEHEEDDEKDLESKDNNANRMPKSSQGKKFTESEHTNRGEVKMSTYHSYIKAAGGVIPCFSVCMSIFLTVASTSFSSWWLAVWLKAGSGNTTVFDPVTNETVISTYINDNPDLNYYMQVYAGIIGLIAATNLMRSLTFTKITVAASRILHNNFLEKLMKTRLRYFEVTPIGRIQGYFTRDISEIDYWLPGGMETLIQNIWVVAFAFLLITIVFPWFLVALVFFAVLYYTLGKIFRVAIRDLKRIEAVSRAPVFSYITATVNGLPVIKAFGKECDFLSRFCKTFDEHSVCSYMSNCAMRWQAVRLDLISVLIALTTSLLVVILKGEVAPALAGLALTYSAHISGVFQYTLRLMSETEGRFIAVERLIMNTKKLEQETNPKHTVEVSSKWPSSGSIKFQNVVLSYSRDLPPVLNGISFSIKAGERIGIVGRTGAGKSSLIAAVFRLVELDSGAITIDGVDISTVALSTLRNRLSVIPQDPVIFTGTLRSNLDPFGEYKDDGELWTVLKQTKLYDKVQSLPKGLSTVLGEGGDNLSMGESQLLCLARALLRRSKIIILDEATASVDPDTETAVQTIIDENFKHCTILTIAHRLKTVKNCDRVLVINHGMVQEFDNPNTLLQNENSFFSTMSRMLK